MFSDHRKRKAMDRRNYQMNATRRTGVHPAPENNSSDKRTKQTPERRGPYKLGPELIRKFCEGLRAYPGIPVEAICDSLGVGRATFYEWLQEAKQQPGTIYETFATEVTEAMGASWKSLHELAAKAKPEQILFRRYPTFYPLAKAELDVSTGGLPITMPQSFNVVLELADKSEKEERTFSIS
jgi:hypothetical protein